MEPGVLRSLPLISVASSKPTRPLGIEGDNGSKAENLPDNIYNAPLNGFCIVYKLDVKQ